MSEGAIPELESDLLDIAGGADDDAWLLQNLPSEGVSVLSNTSAASKNGYFNCSPLQIPRSNRALHVRLPLSPIGEVMGNKTMEKSSPSVVTDNVDRENISGNKLELSKLSVERQKMKRKKKTAGFNLRKSLAWDPAFFTEEGVLDSVELSIITGNDCQTGGEMLPTIQEERRDSISASKRSCDSPGLRAMKENLFKELPVNSKSKGKKVVGGVLPKNASPSKLSSSSAQRKLLPAQDARSSSKSSGCPRPHAVSSLKRPANAHMGNAQNKELRVSKVSAMRSDPPKITNTVKKYTQAPSKLKQIQSVRSIGSSQRSLGFTSSSKKTSSAQINTKSSLASKSSIPQPSVNQARRNMITRPPEIASESNSHHSVAVKLSDRLMTTSDSTLPVPGHGSNFHYSSSTNIAVSVPERSCSSSEHMQSAVPRVPRPSGLRMPLPSIGFFGQSKYPSHGPLEKSSQALPRSDSAINYSSIPTFKKSQGAGNVPRVNTKATSGNTRSLGSTTGFSAPSRLPQPSQEKMKAELESILDMELKLSCNHISTEITDSLQHPSAIPDNADKALLGNAAPCKKSPLCSKYSEQEDKASDGLGDDIKKSCTTENHSALLVKRYPNFKDTMEIQRQLLNVFPLPGNEEEVGICLSGEKDILVVNHSTENVAKQLEISGSCTVHTASCEVFTPIESNVDGLSSLRNQSGNAERALTSSGPLEAQDITKSPYNSHPENMVSDSIQCDHDLVYDGQAVTQLDRTYKVQGSAEANCKAVLADTLPYSSEPTRESEDQHLLCKLVPEVKGDHEIDVMIRNETVDEDDGTKMHIECLTESPVAKKNVEQVNILTPISPEVRIEDQTPKPSHQPFSESLTAEVYKQSNCCSIANKSEEGVGLPIEQSDQLGPSDGCSSSNEANEAAVFCSNEQYEINSVQKGIDFVFETELIIDHNEFSVPRILKERFEFSVPRILKERFLDVEAAQTTSNMSEKTNALGTELKSSPTSTLGDPSNALGTELNSSPTCISGDTELLSKSTDLSRMAECIPKQESNSGSVELKTCVKKAECKTEIMMRTDKESCVQITDQELRSHEEEGVRAVSNSSDPETFATREEKSGTSISTEETVPVGELLQPNEFAVLNADTRISENNVADAPEISGSPRAEIVNESSTYSSEDMDKMNLPDAKLEKRPDPLVVKPPPNAVPFSDEWLAAIEAAGEEVLTLKTGPVQHSPPEKPTHEPGPWSPVKRKNNQGVGPFDCTKFTNKGLPPASD
ncbi:PREDICTED: uncharacterized protein LOC104810833 isoform X2 [Tarenaya hassleriana]|uniref:uncharacterized protein LOC104810833 isoform X2 n=1 Tax=Tarenaya hassleriana TaxID=28532 RepID=UPI00053CA0F8|nr:PREDICTED: uncharacterized protein LOC104810833 isoform X2 [Tarenaya hassleriana]